MRIWLPFTISGLLLAGAIAAIAYPNFNATTGLVGVPNANIVAPGAIDGAADLVFFDDTFVNVRGVIGLSPRLEGGIGGVIGHDSGVLLNLKYQFASRPAGFTTAFGTSFVSASDSGSGWQAYLVGTQQLAPGGIYGTLGVSFTNLDHASAIRPFVGAQWVLGGGTEVGGEFELESGSLGRSVSSLYLRHLFTPRLSGQIGFTNANGFVGNRNHDLFVGASLAFGR